MKDILILVPYRNREKHLEVFFELTPKFFDERGITYDILIAELDQGGDWNCGLCCNSVVEFAEKGKYKYLYRHDVDVYPYQGEWVFPKDDEVFVGIGDWGSFITKFDNFIDIGGYGNEFWGWGYEDKYLYRKVTEYGLRLVDKFNDSVIYDRRFCHHKRIINKINQKHNLKKLEEQIVRDMGGISEIKYVCEVHSLLKLSENVYKHNIRPLIKSPVDTLKKENNMELMNFTLFTRSKDYFEYLNNKKIDSVKSMYTDEIILQDWVGSWNGIDEVINANEELLKNNFKINIINIKQIDDKTFNEIEIQFDNEKIHVMDVITFNDDNKIVSIRAYKG
jgi:hypothetical protein